MIMHIRRLLFILMVGSALLLSAGVARAQGAGSALSFDGGNWVDCGDAASVRIASNVTIEAWIRPDVTSSTRYAVGTPYDDGATWDAPWVGHHIGVRDGQMTTWLNINGTDREYNAGSVTAGAWTHLAMTFDGTTRRSYINGVEVYSSNAYTGTIQFSGTPAFVIGVRSADALGEYFDGILDEVRVWDVTRTQAQIRDWMHATGGLTSEAGLVSVWHLDDAAGTTAVDGMASNDGTLAGGAGTPTWVPISTAPFGDHGAFVVTTAATSVGPAGGQMAVTITSTPDDTNNLGIYQLGSLAGPLITGEVLPVGFDKRSSLVWGITERGTVTADVVFDYSGQPGVTDPSTIEILMRNDAADGTWDEITESARNDLAMTITLTGVAAFGEYTLGAGTDNGLQATLVSFDVQ